MSASMTNAAKRPTNVTKPAQNDAMGTMVSSGRAWWDMMFDLQRASLLPFSIYSPSARTNGATHRTNTGVEVIPVGEERLNVGTRVVQGETVRVTRRVVEQPVEQEVLLRDEKVIVERRPLPAGAAASGAKVLSETVVEMSNSSQVPTVWKSVHVGEEVVLRRQVTERTERVRETLRRDVVDVQQERAEVPAPRAPALAYDTEAATQRAAQAESAKRPVEAHETVKQADKPVSQDNGPRKN